MYTWGLHISLSCFFSCCLQYVYVAIKYTVLACLVMVWSWFYNIVYTSRCSASALSHLGKNVFAPVHALICHASHMLSCMSRHLCHSSGCLSQTFVANPHANPHEPVPPLFIFLFLGGLGGGGIGELWQEPPRSVPLLCCLHIRGLCEDTGKSEQRATSNAFINMEITELVHLKSDKHQSHQSNPFTLWTTSVKTRYSVHHFPLWKTF